MLGFWKAMKIKVSRRMKFLGNVKITIKQDGLLLNILLFDSNISIDNNLEDNGERVNELEGQVNPDGAFDSESIDASFYVVWGNPDVASHSQSQP